jgi:hypothetical protein
MRSPAHPLSREQRRHVHADRAREPLEVLDVEPTSALAIAKPARHGARRYSNLDGNLGLRPPRASPEHAHALRQVGHVEKLRLSQVTRQAK